MFKRDETGKEATAEPYAEVARFFTESRLLQRDVKIILEGKYMHKHTPLSIIVVGCANAYKKMPQSLLECLVL